MKRMKELTPFGKAVTQVLYDNRVSTAEMARQLGLTAENVRLIYYGIRPLYEYQKKIAGYIRKHFGIEIEVDKPKNRSKN